VHDRVGAWAVDQSFMSGVTSLDARLRTGAKQVDASFRSLGRGGWMMCRGWGGGRERGTPPSMVLPLALASMLSHTKSL